MDDDAGKTYGQYCPISRALDVIGDRWTLMIVRDMIVGSSRFNDLARGLPGLSRTLLTKRLRQLERAGLARRSEDGYVLTDAGRALEPVVFGIGEWGAAWAFDEPDPHELDVELLVWWMHARLDTSSLPGRRHVIHLRFRDDRRRWWIVIEEGVPSVCASDPGFEVDVAIDTDVSTMYQVWMGRLALADAVRAGRLELLGAPSRTRRIASVLQLSPAAPLVQAARRRTR